MAVPSTATFRLNFDEIIDAATARMGGEKVAGYNARAARRSAQVMLSDWSNRGIQMWTVEPLSVPLVAGTAAYLMPEDCVDVLDMSIMDQSSLEITVQRIGRTQYQNIANKASRGRPFQVFVDRQRDEISGYFYPVPDKAYTLTGFYRRRLRDITGFRVDLDVPFRFYEAFISGITYYLYRESEGMGEGRLARLKMEYMEALEQASDADQDSSPLFIAPDVSVYTTY